MTRITVTTIESFAIEFFKNWMIFEKFQYTI